MTTEKEIIGLLCVSRDGTAHERYYDFRVRDYGTLIGAVTHARKRYPLYPPAAYLLADMTTIPFKEPKPKVSDEVVVALALQLGKAYNSDGRAHVAKNMANRIRRKCEVTLITAPFFALDLTPEQVEMAARIVETGKL